jgi:hypothetical protein
MATMASGLAAHSSRCLYVNPGILPHIRSALKAITDLRIHPNNKTGRERKNDELTLRENGTMKKKNVIRLLLLLLAL